MNIPDRNRKISETMKKRFLKFPKPRGDKSPRWKGGRIKRSGYWYIKSWGHPMCGKQGYVAEHRLVMEKHLKRYLSKLEVVHHKNHITTDNRIANLELCESPGKHVLKHHPEALIAAAKVSRGRRPANYRRVNIMCPICNKSFEGKPSRKFCGYDCYYKSKIST